MLELSVWQIRTYLEGKFQLSTQLTNLNISEANSEGVLICFLFYVSI